MIAALVIVVGAALFGGSVTIFGPRLLVRTTGAPNVFTFTFSSAGAAAPYLLHIDNHGVTSAVVTLNGVQILGPNDFKATNSDDWKKPDGWDDNDWDETQRSDRGDDSQKDKNSKSDDDWRKDHDWKSLIERTVTLRASNTLRIELRSKPGSHLSIRVTGTDAAPPSITGAAAPPSNAAGWNRTDVQVTFTCTSAGSPIASCTPPVLVTTEGRAQVITGRAVNAAGSTATANVTLNIDKTAPTLNASMQPPANDSGWVNQNATVSFACADVLSGVSSCSSPVIVSTDGSRTVPGAAADVAGNTSASSIDVKVDKTAPVITAVASPEPNAQGWNRGDVTVAFTCTDGASGIADCPSPVTVSADGAGQRITGTARDRAGNTASTFVTVNIDKTVPTISLSSAPAPNADGWNHTDVTASFTCSDAGSGVSSCPDPVTVTSDGAQQLVSGSVTDQAGNTATATATIKIDKTAPTITAAALPLPSADGWIHSDATVTFTCSDAGSGIATCPAAVTVTSKGANQVVSGTATDRAGNSTLASVTLNILKTPSLISATVDPAPNTNGWNRTNVVVTFTCSGTGSSPCPSPVTVTTEGAGQVVTGRFTDLAGHTSEASVTLNIDKSAPTISAVGAPVPNGAGWNRTDVLVSFTCSDSLSGIGTCPAPVTASAESAGQTIAGTAVDRAGNSADASALVRIDRTPPEIAASIVQLPAGGRRLDSQ